jgi:Armadillo/beta-catenin-like repeat
LLWFTLSAPRLNRSDTIVLLFLVYCTLRLFLVMQQALVVSLGVVPPLMEMLRTGEPLLQEAAVDVLSTLTYENLTITEEVRCRFWVSLAKRNETCGKASV